MTWPVGMTLPSLMAFAHADIDRVHASAEASLSICDS